jgi:hypothetical protein
LRPRRCTASAAATHRALVRRCWQTFAACACSRISQLEARHDVHALQLLRMVHVKRQRRVGGNGVSRLGARGKAGSSRRWQSGTGQRGESVEPPQVPPKLRLLCAHRQRQGDGGKRRLPPNPGKARQRRKQRTQHPQHTHRAQRPQHTRGARAACSRATGPRPAHAWKGAGGCTGTRITRGVVVPGRAACMRRVS